MGAPNGLKRGQSGCTSLLGDNNRSDEDLSNDEAENTNGKVFSSCVAGC